MHLCRKCRRRITECYTWPCCFRVGCGLTGPRVIQCLRGWSNRNRSPPDGGSTMPGGQQSRATRIISLNPSSSNNCRTSALSGWMMA